jgi:hypothetical protein
MQKYGYRRTAARMLCQKAHEDIEAAETESCQRRQSADCQSATFRAQGALDKGSSHSRAQCVHPGAIQEVNVHGKADRHMKLLTIETESRLGTLWDQEECNQFCSKEELWEAARDEDVTPVAGSE